jgi:hypothetical protein
MLLNLNKMSKKGFLAISDAAGVGTWWTEQNAFR